MIDYKEMGEQIRAWQKKVIAQARSVNPKLKQLKGRVKFRDGAPWRVSFTFPRHYVFLEKGVGRGRPVGSNKAKPKPAINPAVGSNVDELADIAANGFADAAVSNLFIK